MLRMNDNTKYYKSYELRQCIMHAWSKQQGEIRGNDSSFSCMYKIKVILL